jgi:PrcB C-terminal
MRLPFLAVVFSFLANACALFPPSKYNVSDLILYGIQERHLIFYGEVTGERHTTLDGVKHTLTNDAVVGAFTVPGSLAVDGKPTLQLQPKAAREVFALATIPLSNELSVLTREKVEKVVYFDGKTWFDVGSDLEENTKLRLPKTERQGLRGLGKLSDSEADTLEGYLKTQYKNKPLAIGLLTFPNIPDGVATLDPRPDRYDLTALYVQVDVPLDLLGGFANNQPLELKPLLNGSNAAYGSDSSLVRLDRNTQSFNQTWKIMNGNFVPVPSAPNVDFSRNKVLTVFLGQRPTGGYSIVLASAKLDGQTLVVSANVRNASAGAVTTQVITSPFSSVLVSGGKFSSVRVVNAATREVIGEIIDR